jgi:hypothetical protein
LPLYDNAECSDGPPLVPTIMAIPGFTAEATLYPTHRYYRTVATGGEPHNDPSSAESFFAFETPRTVSCATRCANICRRRCASNPQTCDYDYCFEECIDIHCCEEHCEPCKLFGGQCQQFCIDDDCNQGMVPCDCPPGQTCTAEGCCPTFQACGNSNQYCCTGGDVCRNQQCCTPCGADCCERGMICKDGQCCTPHGSFCCKRGETSYSQGCCPLGQYCGNDVCCPPPNECIDVGVCCAPEKACGQNPMLCCDKPGQICCRSQENQYFCGVSCGTGCCRPEEVCCNGKCYSPGSTCCGSIGCASGDRCCGDHCCPRGAVCCMNNAEGSGGQGCCYADGPESAYCCTRGNISTCCRLGDTCCFSRFENGLGQMIEVPYCCPKNGRGTFTCGPSMFFCVDQGDPNRGIVGYTGWQPPYP